MATGSWDTSPNLFRCNLELFRCEEVDFKSEDGKLKATWVLSYSKIDGEYCCTRPLTDETSLLFTQRMYPIDLSPKSSTARRELISFIRHHFSITSNSVLPHAGGKTLPQDGDWTTSPFNGSESTEEDPLQGNLSVCTTSTCRKVVYHWSDPTGYSGDISCIWVLAGSNQDPTVVAQNRNAQFFFTAVQ
jgi:hypothetical protein